METSYGIIFALAGFVSVFLVVMAYVLSNVSPKNRKNKDSIWVCQHCKLRFKNEKLYSKIPTSVIWTWTDVAQRGSPICETCDSDMDLDIKATENQ